MLTAKDISERLARDVDRVVRYLLPGGKMDGGNWCVGSAAGDTGKSMRIQVSGSKAGLWADFAGTDRGDILDLWRVVKGITMGAAIKEAKQWLGIVDPSASNPPRKYVKPTVKGIISLRKAEQVTEVEKYLVNERKLTRETITAFKVGQIDHPGVGLAMAFPSENTEGSLLAVKYIGLTRDEAGKKKISQEKDQAPCLFGWQAFRQGERVVVLTEGQIDAMTWTQQYGGPCALSIPNGCAGGGHDNWIDYEWDNLLQFDKIYISFDMDKEGETSAAIVARRLGIHRCFIVKLPYNDANDCLQKGCEPEVFARALVEAKPMAPKEIRTPLEFEQEIMERENPDPDAPTQGFVFPVLGPLIQFLPGEVTIWTGHAFHGKSTLLTQLALNAAIGGQGVAIGSFEMRGRDTCSNLSKCLAFKADLKPILRDCLEWLSGKIWIFDVIGFITQPKLKELMLYSVMRHGVKHVIVDSLMKCDLSCEDYEAQRRFFNDFGQFANEYGIHLHIVAHPRKGDHGDIPDINDIHGGQAIGGQVQNIITVWRNLKKTEGKLKAEEAARMADAAAYIRKNRDGGDRFSVPLWYHKGCHRFTSKAEEEPYYENYNIIQIPT